MKKIFTQIIAFAVLAFTIQSCGKTSNPEPVTPTVTVAGLFSLSGNWSSLGITSKAAMQVALEDINAYLTNKNAAFRMGATVGDTKLDTTLAKNLLTAAKNQNIGFFIGPQSSAELAAIKPLVDAANVIVVSQSSTAGSLAIADDGIFRFCPSDRIEGAAIATTIYDAGIRGLVTVARDDAGNKGLQTATGTAFTTRGGQVSALTPYAQTGTNFAVTIAGLLDEVENLTAIYGEGKVAVYLASFDECKELFKLAAAHPTLKSIKWYGGDGVVQSTVLTADAAAADFAFATSFFAPSFGLSPAHQEKWKPIAARIKAITNTEPDAFALAVYDAMWTIARTVEAATPSNAGTYTQLKTLFAATANTNNSILGSDQLDQFGDKATGTFDYWGIVKEGTTYKWVVTGKSGE